ncbi:hypothetical protein B0H63DRAFT_472198 [Podospora didyma]|uniref:Prokaryotic-type class I peptide chain release factors domain-containing protein n=1 Tax=Podospora didyma TaxID=330526 RepID=A0AAE0TZC5_9PEZI|nr:hypothetical protein B0H63DRAFT_472198 [Podospora didyma]
MQRLTCVLGSLLPQTYLPNRGLFSLSLRFARYEAFDAAYDQEHLADARKWHRSFRLNSLPRGNTSFSRSSGPGGQHVNKTESKATTTWPVSQLLVSLPRILHPAVRSSKYYSKSSDSINIQAQTQRGRTTNTEENHKKLFEELQRLYEKAVPGETSEEKATKYEALKKNASETRLRMKKIQGSKKLSRKGYGSEE